MTATEDTLEEKNAEDPRVDDKLQGFHHRSAVQIKVGIRLSHCWSRASIFRAFGSQVLSPSKLSCLDLDFGLGLRLRGCWSVHCIKRQVLG